MSGKSFRQESKEEWTREVPDGSHLSVSELQFGAVLRIADAVEKMAAPFARLVEENETLKRRAKERGEYMRKLERQLAATRGVVSRMKRTQREKGTE